MILVAGASGFVGSALLPALLAPPSDDVAARRPVRALVRREFDAVRLRAQGVETVTGDLIDGRGLDTAMRGVKTLVYLVHTLDRGGDVVANDLLAVQNALIAARAAGVQRVIYLSHVGAAEDAPAQHLVARWATELAVRQSRLAWTVLRAPLIVGAGCTVFELIRRTVARSPVVPLFRWRRTEIEPVALADVVEALVQTIDDPGMTERSYDITGPERMTCGAAVKGWARAAGKHRLFVPLPGWGEPFEEQLAWSLVRLPRRETRLLLETLRARQVCTDPSRRFPLGRRPVSYEDAVQAVLRER
jgi:uncharacterized protein YbjT (DUF2867 family)